MTQDIAGGKANAARKSKWREVNIIYTKMRAYARFANLVKWDNIGRNFKTASNKIGGKEH